jgi:hypothetical protein
MHRPPEQESTSYNTLFQQQTIVLTVQSQKVINAFNEIPEEYYKGKVEPPQMEFPPAGSSMTNSQSGPNAASKHPMGKMRNLQADIISLRKLLDIEHKNKHSTSDLCVRC